MKRLLCDRWFLIMIVVIAVNLYGAVLTRNSSAMLGWFAAVCFMTASTLFRKEAKKQAAIAASRKRWQELIDDAFERIQKTGHTVRFSASGSGETLAVYFEDNLAELHRERGRVERLRAAMCTVFRISETSSQRPLWDVVQDMGKIRAASSAALKETR